MENGSPAPERTGRRITGKRNCRILFRRVTPSSKKHSDQSPGGLTARMETEKAAAELQKREGEKE